MISVTIAHVGIDGQPSATTRHRASEPFEAVEKSIAKVFGKKAALNVDSETSLPRHGVWYGQVVKPNGSCMTGRLRLSAVES